LTRASASTGKVRLALPGRDVFVGLDVKVTVGVRVWVEVGGGVNVARPGSNVKLSVNVPLVEPTNCAEMPVSETVYFMKP
jgi:hypothetical protein